MKLTYFNLETTLYILYIVPFYYLPFYKNVPFFLKEIPTAFSPLGGAYVPTQEKKKTKEKRVGFFRDARIEKVLRKKVFVFLIINKKKKKKMERSVIIVNSNIKRK